MYLYAVLRAAPRADAGTGMTGERLRLLACGEVLAVAGEVSAPPPVSPDTLRAHDAVVRRLAQHADAVLPARFGMLADDERALCERLARVASGLAEALARVAGREQMILRVFRENASTDDAARANVATGADLAAGAGARYLEERARAHRAAAVVPELAALRPTLDRFVAAERVEHHDAPPLVASAYHLIARGRGAAYTAAVQDAARTLRGARVTISGPWAPYAFASDALA